MRARQSSSKLGARSLEFEARSFELKARSSASQKSWPGFGLWPDVIRILADESRSILVYFSFSVSVSVSFSFPFRPAADLEPQQQQQQQTDTSRVSAVRSIRLAIRFISLGFCSAAWFGRQHQAAIGFRLSSFHKFSKQISIFGMSLGCISLGFQGEQHLDSQIYLRVPSNLVAMVSKKVF